MDNPNKGGQRVRERANTGHRRGARSIEGEDNRSPSPGRGGRERGRGERRGRSLDQPPDDRREAGWRERGESEGDAGRGDRWREMEGDAMREGRGDGWRERDRNAGRRRRARRYRWREREEDAMREGRGDGCSERERDTLRGRRGDAMRRGGRQAEGWRDRRHTVKSPSEARKLEFKALQELVGKEPSEMAITLSSSPGLKLLLEERVMSHGLIQLLCQALSKAMGSRTDRRIVQHLGGLVKDSRFLRMILSRYITDMISDDVPHRRAQYPQHLDNIISLLSNVVSIFPTSSMQVSSMLVAHLRSAINGLQASGVNISGRTKRKLDKIQGLINHFQDKAKDETLWSDDDIYLTPDEDAPPGEGDFRTMTIYPTGDEIHQDQKPLFRPNITSGSYPSSQVYMDTHFRLLRENFVQPLREGIRELLQCDQEQSLGQVFIRRKSFNDIRVYFDTHLLGPFCTLTGMAYKVQFDSHPLKCVNWKTSKRLLFGSLVCLSRDNFETVLFATVADREPADLQNGQVKLSFFRDSHLTLGEVQMSDSFLMVETTAYFEAYRYILEGLQEQEVDDLPFQQYIVECKTDVAPPAYLTTRSFYNLTSIAAPGFEQELEPFSIHDPLAWPPMESLGLEESQMRALKLALTKELAIIQGPPGTGKTYVGLKIAQALLANTHVWQQGDVNVPVLVVCNTNYVLDQFLEGIYKFLKNGIVRVGGRSNSKVLKHFTLKELTSGPAFHRSLPTHLRCAQFEISTELQQAEKRIQQQAGQLKSCLKGVLHEQYLERFIPKDHWDSLRDEPVWDGFQCNGAKQSMILEWLGQGSSNFQQRGELPNAENADKEQENKEELGEVEAEMYDKGSKKRNKAEVATVLKALNLDHTEREPGLTPDGWEMQAAQKKKRKQQTRKELTKGTAMTLEEEKTLKDLWRLTLSDRWRLYRLWLWRYQTDMRAKALQLEQAYQDIADRLAEVRMRQHVYVLQEARVIGMTTAGAAKYRQALQEIGPCIIIVEEADEVLEGHTIATLKRTCQHLILIGDNQQPRPSATIYELAKNFSLEVSLFERLIKLDFPFVQLSYQQRMRTEIARRLTPEVYSQLVNHPSFQEDANIEVCEHPTL